MARFVKGNIVVVPFPFSDLTQVKKRPAFVVTRLGGDDLILCQITSKKIKDKYSIPIDDGDFDVGSLRQTSNVRPNRIFTVDGRIILYKVGKLKEKKVNEIVERLVEII